MKCDVTDVHMTALKSLLTCIVYGNFCYFFSLTQANSKTIHIKIAIAINRVSTYVVVILYSYIIVIFKMQSK